MQSLDSLIGNIKPEEPFDLNNVPVLDLKDLSHEAQQAGTRSEYAFSLLDTPEEKDWERYVD